MKPEVFNLIGIGRSEVTPIVPKRMVEAAVPFAAATKSLVDFNKVVLNEVVPDRLQRSYLAFESVRRSPVYFDNFSTGFEGYYTGSNLTPEQVRDELIQFGRGILLSLNRFDSGKRSKYLKTLAGEQNCLPAFSWWDTQLAAVLAQLKAKMNSTQINGSDNDPNRAHKFRDKTYEMVNTCPQMLFRTEETHIRQRYEVPVRETINAITLKFSSLSDGDQQALSIMKDLGKFGHPVVRQLIIPAAVRVQG